MAKKKTASSKTSRKTSAGPTKKSKPAVSATKKKAAAKTSASARTQKQPASKGAPRQKAEKTDKLPKQEVKQVRPAGPVSSPLPWLNKAPTTNGQAKKAPVLKITAKMKTDFQKKLLAIREDVAKQIAFLATDNINLTKSDAEMDYHSEEQGTDNFNRDFALNRVSSEQEVIFEIDEALNRLEVGGFGICEGCSGGIEKERIHALPHTRMCITCQSTSENKRKHFKPFNSGALFSGNDDEPIPSAEDEN